MKRSMLLALLAGCPGPSHDQPDARPDTPPDVHSKDPASVRMRTGGSQVVTVALNVDGAWQTVPVDPDGNYTFGVDAPFVVATVCTADEGPAGIVTSAAYYARTPTDGDFDGGCFTGFPPTASVQGTLVQTGTMWIGDGVADASGAFSVDVSPGTWNAAAVTDSAIELRRNIVVTAPTTTLTPDFDVVKNGVALLDASFSATNAKPGDTVKAEVMLHTSGVDVFQDRIDASAVKVAPDSLYQTGEGNSVSVSIETPTTGQFLRRIWKVGDPTAFTLPPPLDPIVFTPTATGVVQTMPALPTGYGEASLVTSDANGFGEDIDFTEAYLDAVGKITYDQTPLPAAIQFDFTKPFQSSFLVQRVVNGDLISQDAYSGTAFTNQAPGRPRRSANFARANARK